MYELYEAQKDEQEKARLEADRLKEKAQAATCKVADGVLDAVNSGLSTSHSLFSSLPMVHPAVLYVYVFSCSPSFCVCVCLQV